MYEKNAVFKNSPFQLFSEKNIFVYEALPHPDYCFHATGTC